MNIKEFYAVIKGDYEGTISRFLTEDRMYRFALKFENDQSFAELCQALDDGRVSDAFRAAHTLKGVCQNLGFDALYKPAHDVTEILRAGSLNVGGSMDELKTQYGIVITAIKKLKSTE